MQSEKHFSHTDMPVASLEHAHACQGCVHVCVMPKIMTVD